jgi:hypothetical protein
VRGGSAENATPAAQLEWKEPDEEGLVQFLCKEKGFNEERVRVLLARSHERSGA